MRSRSAIAVTHACAGILLAVAVGCSQKAEPVRQRVHESRGGPVIVIVADALRYDFDRMLGYEPVPGGIMQFRREATEFKKAFVLFPATAVSFSGLLSGYRVASLASISPRDSWIAAFRRAGYRTEFVGSSAASAFTLSATDVDALFDTSSFENKQWMRPLSEAVRRSIKAIEKRPSDKLLLIIHLFFPHAPYFYSSYGDNVTILDAAVADILTELRHANIYDKAHILFTSDHGESLQEHDSPPGHGWLIYDEQTRIPLFWKEPAQQQFRVSDELVRNWDIGPTLEAAVLGEKDRSGDTRRGLTIGSIVETKHQPRFAYHYAGASRIKPVPQVGIRDDRYLVVRDEAGYANAEVYDYTRDEGEVYNIAATPEGDAALRRLSPKLNEWIDVLAHGLHTDHITKEASAQLRSLGYLGTGPSTERQTMSLRQELSGGRVAIFRSCAATPWAVYAAETFDELYPTRLIVDRDQRLYVVQNASHNLARLYDSPGPIRGPRPRGLPYYQPWFQRQAYKLAAGPSGIVALQGAQLRPYYTDEKKQTFSADPLELVRAYEDVSYVDGLGWLLFSADGIYLRQRGRAPETPVVKISSSASRVTYAASRKTLYIASGTKLFRVVRGGQPEEMREFGGDIVSVAYHEGKVWVGLAPRSTIVIGMESFENDNPILVVAADTGKTVFKFGKRFTQSPKGDYWGAIDAGPFGFAAPDQISFVGSRLYVLDSGMERILSFDIAE